MIIIYNYLLFIIHNSFIYYSHLLFIIIQFHVLIYKIKKDNSYILTRKISLFYIMNHRSKSSNYSAIEIYIINNTAALRLVIRSTF